MTRTWFETTAHKPTTYEINSESYLRQLAAARRIEQAYVAYAREIGCVVDGDAIVVISEQVAKLAAKWKELTT